MYLSCCKCQSSLFMLFSFLNLCILSFLSRFSSLYARFIFKTHLMLKVTHGRVFFSACSSWINILTSSTWVCSDGIPHWLHLFPLFKHLLCQLPDSLWAENKSRESFPLQRNLRMFIFSSSRQLSKITPEPQRRWMEEWNLKESTQLDPVSHISQYDCKSSSNKALS